MAKIRGARNSNITTARIEQVPGEFDYDNVNTEENQALDGNRNNVMEDPISDRHVPSTITSSIARPRTKIEELANWAIVHNITHTALSVLLSYCQNWMPKCKFPKDPRTLLQTPKSVNITRGVNFSISA